MIAESAKTEYWRVVQLCLISLFGYSEPEAASTVKKLRAEVEDTPVGDIFYHGEPLDVACDVSGNEPTPELRARYTKLICIAPV
jgi:hypothetical protein